MEVHGHTHTPRKKWTHYFWEFLMLFLAVFCGFLAENIREHKIEHRRAKALAASLYDDFKQDTASIKLILNIRKNLHSIFDTLMEELEKPILSQNDTMIFFVAGKHLTERNYFVPTTGTYDQIKQSGSLRYFNQNIGFNLVQYESKRDLLTMKLDLENKFVFENIVPFLLKNLNQRFLKTSAWNLPCAIEEILVTKSPALRNELYGQTNFLKQRSIIYMNTLYELDSLSGICLDLLKKEYHLK